MAGIDMNAIKEAIARRQGGGSTPALSTQGAPAGATPTGGPSTPTVQAPVVPTPTSGGLPPAPTAQPTPQGTKPAPKQPNNFDDETKTLAKALITKLLGAV